MKKVFLSLLSLLAIATLQAQQKEGKVTYQRTVQMQMTFNNGSGNENVAQTRKDKFELNFSNNRMSYKMLDEELPEDNFGGGGMVVRTIGSSPDDVVYCDFEAARKVEQREFMEKRFLITDSIRQGNWKLGEETKTVLGHLCRKAVSQRTGKKMQMVMENGKMERKEIDDTTSVVAWFTTDIPVSAGPEFQGQLPGMILELETNNGRTVYTALDISPKADLSAIKEPTKGKKVNTKEFADERNKILDEMQRNGGGTFRVRAG